MHLVKFWTILVDFVPRKERQFCQFEISKQQMMVWIDPIKFWTILVKLGLKKGKSVGLFWDQESINDLSNGFSRILDCFGQPDLKKRESILIISDQEWTDDDLKWI